MSAHPDSDSIDSAERDRRVWRLVAHAWEHVPFYRERWERAGVRPGEIRRAADLARLPVTEKSDLLARPADDVVARGTDPDALVATMTSGYSGEPLVVRRTRAEQSLWARTWLRDLLDAGLRRGDRVASIFVLREGRPDGISQLTALGVVEETMIDCCLDPDEIRAALRRERPTFLRGLPSVVERVAGLLTDADRARVRPRVVWVSGEVLTPSARARIEAGFGAPVHDAYGTHEVGLVAADCPATGLKHLGRRNLVVELVEPAGGASLDGTRELLVTPLRFLAAPLVRYRLTDAVAPGPVGCPCGRPGPTLARVEGRTIDYFELPDGRAVHPYRILAPLLNAAPWIRRYQLVQEAPDRIVLRHVSAPEAGTDGARGLREAVADVLGPEIRFAIEAVDRIESAEGGKPRPIVSRVNGRRGAGV